MSQTPNDVADWWSTAIIDMEPGRIHIRGHPIQELIGTLSFVQMIWLMLRGQIPEPGAAALLEHALVAAVDHGPQAPSIATARMAVTCGAGLNQAMASAVNLLDDVHGGAGAQALALYQRIAAAGGVSAVPSVLDALAAEGVAYVPGFGHRFHTPTDPRAPRLMALAREAAAADVCSAAYVDIGLAVEAEISARKSRPIPMNIDGATAVIFGALGFDPQAARGLFCLSRSVGILAHAMEQQQQGGRNKGPTPPRYRWTYTGA